MLIGALVSMEEENKNPPEKHNQNIIVCALVVVVVALDSDRRNVWMAYTRISRARTSRPNIEGNAGICVREMFLRCIVVAFLCAICFLFAAHSNFSWRFFCLLQHFLDISCCSFIAYPPLALSFAPLLLIQPGLIALRWKRRSHNVWLPIRIKIRLTFFPFAIISLTNRWRLQWDYNCFV